MKNPIVLFLVRWLLNSMALWAAFRVFGSGYNDIDVAAGFGACLIAGLIFSFVNAVLRPILIILSLPAIVWSLGLFMLVVNGILVYVTLALAPNLSMTFLNSIITGMMLSLVNYIVSSMANYQPEKK